MRWSLRLPVAVATALATTEAAVLMLRPRPASPGPAPVAARGYFSEELRRATAFRRSHSTTLERIAMAGEVLASAS